MGEISTSSEVASFLSNLVGAIGGVLGSASFVLGRQAEKKRENEEKEMWELLSYFAKAQEKHGDGGKNVFVPEKGSKEHRLAEKLVEKGMFARSPMGGYWLSDANTNVDPYHSR